MPEPKNQARAILSAGIAMHLAACSLIFDSSQPTEDTQEGNDASPVCIPNGLRYQSELRIRFDGFGEGLSNVPVPIRFSSTHLSQYGIPDDPSSLFFVHDGQRIPHEIEAWSSNRGLAWVTLPSYPASGATVELAARYGGDSVSVMEDPVSVWSGAGYSAVFHFQASAFFDSLNPDAANTVGDGIVGAGANASIMGEARFFPPNSEETIILDNHTSHQGAGLDLSLEIRYYLNPGTGKRFLVQKDGAFAIIADNGDNRSEGRVTLTNTGDEAVLAGPAVAPLTWSHAALEISSDPRNASFFVDGSRMEDPKPLDSDPPASMSDLVLGASLNGFVDEFRISQRSRGPEWYELQSELQNGSLQRFGDLRRCGQ